MSLSSTRNTQATITYQESESRSTRAFPRLTSYSGYHVATAKHGSLPMELHSLMNYQNVTQNLFCVTHFFSAFPGRVFYRPPTSPFSSKPSTRPPPHPYRDRLRTARPRRAKDLEPTKSPHSPDVSQNPAEKAKRLKLFE